MPAADPFENVAMTRVGRVRAPTADELARPDEVLRPDAVIALSSTPEGISPTERRVADLVDGFRPVARIKKKSGLTADALHDALRALNERGALTLVGIVEASMNEPEARYDSDDVESTVPRGTNDAIPAHVMREIDAMLEEVEETRRPGLLADPGSGFEDEKTTEMEIGEE